MNSILLMLSSVLIPIGLAVLVLLAAQWSRKRDARRSPLNMKLLHTPGEQLRQRIDKLTEDIDSALLTIVIVGPMTLLVIVLPIVDLHSLRMDFRAALVVLVALLAIGWSLWRVLGIGRTRRQAKEGLAAELLTAQLLLPLMAQNCLVFHDVPADKFNLDHVVVGSHAVFMIETKSRKKPPSEGKSSWSVDYDGKGLGFPGWYTSKPIDQARHQARWLSDYLKNAAGEPVAVIPVVALPGWFVTLGKDAHRSDVRVINPKMHSLFLDRGKTPLSDSLRTRVAHALTLRYPELE